VSGCNIRLRDRIPRVELTKEIAVKHVLVGLTLPVTAAGEEINEHRRIMWNENTYDCIQRRKRGQSTTGENTL
jgi:hypothetical protein